MKLILNVYQDCIKLKHGRRLSKFGIVSIIETLNSLISKDNKVLASFAEETKKNIA